ncbi:MAG: TonB-dependent receptor [Chlorobi bacterium]|nr:TonB-dependent receptor [Chlorobiota bacterium]
MKIHFVILLLLFFGIVALGQEENKKMFRLDENDISRENNNNRTKVVSASRTGKYLEDLPVTVYVVSRDEILKNGYTTLADVLKDVPGIKVSQPGSGIEGETFLMRGLYGNYYTKILVDDVPVQPSVVSGMPIAGQLPIRQAERIEIILGPASSVYGADAMAGVINIITKTSERPTWAQANLTLGDWGYYGLNMMIGGKVGKNKNVLQYSFFGNSLKMEDMNIKNGIENVYNPALYDTNYIHQPYYKGDSTAPTLGKLPQTSWLGGFNLKYRGFTFQFMKMLRKTHSSIGQKTNLYAYYDPLNYWGETNERYLLGHKKTFGKFTNKANLSFLHYRLDENSSFRMIFETGDQGKLFKYAASDDFLVEDILSFQVNPAMELTAGASFQYSGNLPKTNDLIEPFHPKDYGIFSESIKIKDPIMGDFGLNPINFSNAGIFAQLYHEIIKFSYIIGVRYDNHSLFGSSVNPRIALMYKPKKGLSFRGSFGTGFRAPSLHYVYSSLAYPVDNGIYYRTVPNPGLKPERLIATELGFRFTGSKKITTDVVAFYHILKNQFTQSLFSLDPALYPNAVNPDGFSLAYVNDENSKASLFGVQANLRYKDLIPAIHMGSDLYVSYAKGSEILPNGFGKLEGYRQMPEWYVQFNLDVKPLDSWTILIQNLYSSKTLKRFFPLTPEDMISIGLPTEVKAYYTLDLVVRYHINRNFQAFLKMNNVTNAKYGGIDAYGTNGDLFYNPQYGRTYQVGLSFRME